MMIKNPLRTCYILVFTLVVILVVGCGHSNLDLITKSMVPSLTFQGQLVTIPPAPTSNAPSPKIQITHSDFGEVTLVTRVTDMKSNVDTGLNWLFFEYGPFEKLAEFGLVGESFYLCKIENFKIISCTIHQFLDPHWYTQDYYFSPNGKYLAVSTPNTLWIYQLEPWQEVICIKKEKTRPEIDWAPDSSGILLQFEGGKYAAEFLTLDGVIKPFLTKEEAYPDGFSSIVNPPGLTYWGPIWSPDGTEIAYLRTFPDRQELWIKNMTTENNRLIYNGPLKRLGLHPKWSPDGKKIAIFSGHGIQVIDITLGTIKSLFQTSLSPTNSDSLSIDFSWSPDSKQLAVGCDTSKNPDGVYIVDIETGIGRLIRNGKADILFWKPDGTIVFRLDNGNIGWLNIK